MAKGWAFSTYIKVALNLIPIDPKYSKSIARLLFNTREAFFSNKDEEYEIYHNEKGQEQTIHEQELGRDILKKNSKKKISERIFGVFATIADFLGSPLFTRILFISSGIAALVTLTNPVLLGLAVGGLVISTAFIAKSMYEQVGSFRKLKEIKEQRAILEEIMLLKTQCKFLAKDIAVNSDSDKILQKLGLAALPNLLDKKVWNQHNKFFTRAEPFLNNVPEFALPLAASIVSLSPHGILMCVAGYFFTSYQGGFNGISYKNQMESLHYHNIALADNIGEDILRSGVSIEGLRKALVDSRAKKETLVELKNEKQKIDLNEFNKQFDSKYQVHLATQSKNLPPVIKTTWWQDAGKIWFKDGIFLSKNFRNMHPMTNDFRKKYKTDTFTSSPKPSLSFIEEESLKIPMLVSKNYSKKINSHKRNKIYFDDKLVACLNKQTKKYRNRRFIQLSHAVNNGLTKNNFKKLFISFQEDIMRDKKISDLSPTEQEALKLAERLNANLDTAKTKEIIDFNQQLIALVESTSKKLKNKKFMALANAMSRGASAEELNVCYLAFKRSVITTKRKRARLSNNEKEALKLANLVKFNINNKTR
jgi:hypothetical protein